MPPVEPDDEAKLEQLPQDGPPPFSPPDPARDDSLPPDSGGQPTSQPDDTHPATDDQLDSTQVYNEGAYGAAEVAEPKAGSDVTGFNKAAADPEDEAI